MKYLKVPFFCILLGAMLGGMTVCAWAQAETSTEISGFYQGYRKFDYKVGIEEADIRGAIMRGGGFSVAQNLATWFALWTEFSFSESIEGPAFKVRVINNLQGLRYQTRQYGPFRFYGKGGVGFANFNIDAGSVSGGETKISFGYGGGVQIWAADYLGFYVDASHLIMGLPNLTNLPDRENWDSGLAFKTGLAIRF